MKKPDLPPWELPAAVAFLSLSPALNAAIFRFQDAGGNLLGSELSFTDPPTGAFDWTEFSQNGIVPVGARQVEIELDSRRSAFNSSDGFIDNVSFQLVPEPSTTILGGLASLFLLRRNRCYQVQH